MHEDLKLFISTELPTRPQPTDGGREVLNLTPPEKPDTRKESGGGIAFPEIILTLKNTNLTRYFAFYFPEMVHPLDSNYISNDTNVENITEAAIKVLTGAN